ncbi:hypothetical protein HW555_006380 [Spodoptera exigua]|uniref:ribonuclease H n=1 Tax=Spodoptera exigua TaxID=7107 RepID=A0A835L6I7_SPOEX|nr:hypothetical protein HW555_006380 [Spodoptera exigua]
MAFSNETSEGTSVCEMFHAESVTINSGMRLFHENIVAERPQGLFGTISLDPRSSLRHCLDDGQPQLYSLSPLQPHLHLDNDQVPLSSENLLQAASRTTISSSLTHQPSNPSSYCAPDDAVGNDSYRVTILVPCLPKSNKVINDTTPANSTNFKSHPKEVRSTNFASHQKKMSSTNFASHPKEMSPSKFASHPKEMSPSNFASHPKEMSPSNFASHPKEMSPSNFASHPKEMSPSNFAPHLKEMSSSSFSDFASLPKEMSTSKSTFQVICCHGISCLGHAESNIVPIYHSPGIYFEPITNINFYTDHWKTSRECRSSQQESVSRHESSPRELVSLGCQWQWRDTIGVYQNLAKKFLFNRGFRQQRIQLLVNNCELDTVITYKYLGVWLDRTLRWGKHINEIVGKVQKLINVLKILTGSSWGVHQIHLLRSRLDYGCFLYDSSAKSNIYKLVKVQNQALRVVGGFIRSTPIHVMECELCVPPLHLRRRWPAVKYCLKSRSLSDNVTIKLLSDLSAFRHNRYWSNKKLPLLVSVFEEIKEEIDDDDVSLDTWVSNINTQNIIKIKLDSINKPKKTYDYNLIKTETLKELREKYDEYYIIYTDGSNSAKGNGAAYYDPLKSENNSDSCFKITNAVSVMSLELFAISEALVYIQNYDKRKAVICVDSKSALQHIARCASGCRGASIAYGILSKIHNLTSNGFDLRLQWVPSHIGLHGNEEADRLAKLAIDERKETLFVKKMYSAAGYLKSSHHEPAKKSNTKLHKLLGSARKEHIKAK